MSTFWKEKKKYVSLFTSPTLYDSDIDSTPTYRICNGYTTVS